MSKTINNKKNDLKERTFNFAKQSIDLVKLLPKNLINQRISSQYLDAATAIGAIYREADGADSKRDFKHKMGLSKKEAKESYYWLGLIQHANKDYTNDEFHQLLGELIQEAKELMLIFSKIVYNLK